MAKNVEILSRETIKPSSPTPHDLRHHKLSFLDQLAPRHYIPIVLFYHKESGLSPSEISVLLKKSLADVLTLYYPLAGTTDGDGAVSCNDEGVEFYEARVQCELREVIDKPNAEMLGRFLPFDRSGNCIEEGGRKILLAAQFNMFDCGGVAIGVCLSHIIGDGTSVIAFVNAWATTSRGGSQDIARPTFDSAFYFPDSESESVRDLKRKIKGFFAEKIETRRLVFTKSKIAALKTAASSGENSQVKNPTRVEAVSVFIWERAMAVYRAKSHPKKVFGIFHAVNLRERMIPPLPSYSFGNIYSSAYALSPIELEEDYPVLVSHLRKAIKGIDAEYVEKLKNIAAATCGNDMNLKSIAIFCAPMIAAS
ncbi:hypothetical protein RJ641_014249 [Dillenia turbinata]|uniref:Uncharacterized protein n=1 Tax=Dillenia turbinata TaxID=194707 RepID=A0AAN8UYY7_9MAGN